MLAKLLSLVPVTAAQDWAAACRRHGPCLAWNMQRPLLRHGFYTFF